MLKLTGNYTGPIDGKWTPELTDALKQFQTDAGLPPTGAVDAATLAALEQALAEIATTAATTTTTTAPGSPTTAAAATTTASPETTVEATTTTAGAASTT